MNETSVTLAGWLGGDVTLRDAGGVPVASFRVATTPRRFNRKTGEWSDGDTQWYSVTAWRQLAENCADALRRGDPVVVHGRLTAETWTNKAGINVTSMEVEALGIGHDLNRGVSTFERRGRAPADEVAGEDADDGTGPTSAAAPEPAADASAA